MSAPSALREIARDSRQKCCHCVLTLRRLLRCLLRRAGLRLLAGCGCWGRGRGFFAVGGHRREGFLPTVSEWHGTRRLPPYYYHLAGRESRHPPQKKHYVLVTRERDYTWYTICGLCGHTTHWTQKYSRSHDATKSSDVSPRGVQRLRLQWQRLDLVCGLVHGLRHPRSRQPLQNLLRRGYASHPVLLGRQLHDDDREHG